MVQTLLEHSGRIAGSGVHRFPGSWNPGIIPMPLLWNFVVVLLVALIFWWLLCGSQKSVETPMNMLKKRYVMGEIDRKTYLEMKGDITD
jgi:uncharacterized membrane protein